ncbi:hypothetical protein, partial [Escherichia coli]|uniref:hypothetical protein n=1 Tax=Escherichia coli TaxID=562 RepID=UPI000D4E344F
EGWAILLRQKQKKLIMLPSETMIWQPEFTDKTLSRKPGAVHLLLMLECAYQNQEMTSLYTGSGCVKQSIVTGDRCFIKFKIQL